MAVYLDVAAVQIQSWLARSSDLKGRRGASGLLVELTGREHWQGRLPDGARWNEEAGDVDGVVSLVVDGVAPEPVARGVLAQLRAAMPALPLEAVWSTGDSYVRAYDGLAQCRERSVGLSSVPAPNVAVLAKPCQQCGASPATQQVRLVEHVVAVCEDCVRRYAAAGDTRHPPALLRRVLEDLRALTGSTTDLEVPDTLTELAEVGATGPGERPTRLALVFADGNGVGGFLRRAAHTTGPAAPRKADIAAVIDGATRAAFTRAVADCGRQGNRLAVIPHLVGGDDLLVSVTARYAWPFLLALLEGFEREVAARAGTWPLDVLAAAPTLSAGVVLHHRSRPFTEVLDLARQGLGKAKREAHGSAVYALDLHQDDPTLVSTADRRVRTSTWLRAHRAQVSQWTALPAALQETLRAASRRDRDAAAELRRVAEKSGVPHLTEVLDRDDVDGVQWLLTLTRDWSEVTA